MTRTLFRTALFAALAFTARPAAAAPITLATGVSLNDETGPGLQRDAALTVGNVFYFTWCDGYGCELWRSNGAATGTFMVKDIEPGNGSSPPPGS